MFKTTQELQDFLLWCQRARIKAVKVGDMEVQFSDLAFIDVLGAEQSGSEERDTSKTLVDVQENPESEDDLLFWSSKS